MNAHRVKVLNRADDDDVVAQVAHDFEFIFFPAEYRLFDQRFMDGRKIEATRENIEQFFAIIGNAAARAAQGETWPDDDGEANFAGKLQTIFEIVHQGRFGNIQADALHRIFEVETVFGFLDRGYVGPDELHVIFVEHAAIRKFDCKIQGCLPADRGQNGDAGTRRKLALDTDDLFQVLTRERLNVGSVGRLGIGHDGRRVRIRQHHFKALGLKCLASLRTGVVELSGLSDDDRAGAEDEDFGEVSAFGHLFF